uniref:G_PROTEIN_RECEP_F1_2 domain-containing protein n=1 Tax=Heterorhabditis bacteriophora TaxID=37862 RepID=A0A1I7WQS3_HETBA
MVLESCTASVVSSFVDCFVLCCKSLHSPFNTLLRKPGFIIPTITFIDALFFIFGPNSILRVSMIPAYLIHFSDMSFTNTMYRRPIICRWFFARLMSSVFCNVWFLFAATTSQSSELAKKNVDNYFLYYYIL